MDLIRGRGICFGFTQKQKRRFTKETISVKTKLTFDCSEKDRGPTLFHAGQGIPEDEENKESTETGVVTGAQGSNPCLLHFLHWQVDFLLKQIMSIMGTQHRSTREREMLGKQIVYLDLGTRNLSYYSPSPANARIVLDLVCFPSEFLFEQD